MLSNRVYDDALLIRRAMRQDRGQTGRTLDLPDQGLPGHPPEDESGRRVRIETSIPNSICPDHTVRKCLRHDKEVICALVARGI